MTKPKKSSDFSLEPTKKKIKYIIRCALSLDEILEGNYGIPDVLTMYNASILRRTVHDETVYMTVCLIVQLESPRDVTNFLDDLRGEGDAAIVDVGILDDDESEVEK